MVTFKLMSQTDTVLTYYYYPNGEEDKDFGIFDLDLSYNTIILKKLAEDDFERVITKEELNEMRASINQLRLKNGEAELSEEELPLATEDIISRYYADHAVLKVFEAYKEGEILEAGQVRWG